MKPAPSLYDTLTRERRTLTPRDGSSLRFYACGPTVYGPAHIGNFRTFLAQDIMRRVVELCGWDTLHVRNLTDVDDKTIRESIRANMALELFTTQWTQQFHEDCAELNLLPPHQEPGAVAYIGSQISMIQRLIENGNAYAAEDGSVYFSVSSFPDYGQLSRLKNRDILHGATVTNSDEYEKDAASDFVLWKRRKPEDGPNFWQSPWGDGRPGWHLECSAMIEALLGADFDLHTGGVDLIFPHHENEIAQSLCACGGTFAAHWFHIAHLMVDGGKMSKSLGNLYTVSDLKNLGYATDSIRYALVSGHYHRPLNFRLQSLTDAAQALQNIAKTDAALADIDGSLAPSYDELTANARTGKIDPSIFAPAWNSLLEDLNVPEALGHVFSLLRPAVTLSDSPEKARAHRHGLHVILHAIGIKLPVTNHSTVEVPGPVAALALARWEAKISKNWAESDRLRAEIDTLGWEIKDQKDSYAIQPKKS